MQIFIEEVQNQTKADFGNRGQWKIFVEHGHILNFRKLNQNRLVTRDAPDTDFAGYPAGRISGFSKSRILEYLVEAGYRISGRISTLH
jgi:hypothetical protein